MKHKIFTIGAILVLATQLCYGWGVWGHNHINKGAVLALPGEMGLFFYNHADFIVQESVVPDLRKYTLNDKGEFPRHFINLESFGYTTSANMPATLSEAATKYGKDSLDKYGILPWYMEEMMKKLTEAFRKKNKAEILFLAADLGHYIGDAQMPLHTSINHNGQLTGQAGIHGFWEAQLPELFGKDYNLYTGEAHYIKDINRAVWDMIDSSHALVNMMLEMDKKTREEIPVEKQLEKDAAGQLKRSRFGSIVYSAEYAQRYHTLLNGMVEAQLRNAIRHTADFWYTAWVNAGKPDLSTFDDDVNSKDQYKADMGKWEKQGKVSGCKSDKEYNLSPTLSQGEGDGL